MRKLPVAIALATLIVTAVAPTSAAFAFSSSGGATNPITAPISAPVSAVGTSSQQAIVSVTELSDVSAGDTYYEGSSDYAFLRNPQAVMPGARISTKSGVTCSVGYIASRSGKNYAITAGHCGQVGTEWGIRSAAGTWKRVGSVIKSVDTQDQDWAMLSIDNAAYSPSLPLNVATGAPIAASEAYSADAICTLGQVSGLSCGVYRHRAPSGRLVVEGVASKVDSGGAVFAMRNGVAHPIGILEGGYSNGSLAVQPLDAA